MADVVYGISCGRVQLGRSESDSLETAVCKDVSRLSGSESSDRRRWEGEEPNEIEMPGKTASLWELPVTTVDR